MYITGRMTLACANLTPLADADLHWYSSTVYASLMQILSFVSPYSTKLENDGRGVLDGELGWDPTHFDHQHLYFNLNAEQAQCRVDINLGHMR